MTDPMETAITKREMQASFDAFLAVLMERLDKRFEQVDKRFEQVDKRFEQVDKRFDDLIKHIHTRFDEAHRDMLAVVRASADDVRLEIRAVNKATEALHRDEIAVVDDKYKNLPARVKKLEAAVFRPAPLKRRRTR
jgi:predicted transcriptional regulator